MTFFQNQVSGNTKRMESVATIDGFLGNLRESLIAASTKGSPAVYEMHVELDAGGHITGREAMVIMFSSRIKNRSNGITVVEVERSQCCDDVITAIASDPWIVYETVSGIAGDLPNCSRYSRDTLSEVRSREASCIVFYDYENTMQEERQYLRSRLRMYPYYEIRVVGHVAEQQDPSDGLREFFKENPCYAKSWSDNLVGVAVQHGVDESTAHALTDTFMSVAFGCGKPV